jgi:hypothetical protein
MTNVEIVHKFAESVALKEAGPITLREDGAHWLVGEGPTRQAFNATLEGEEIVVTGAGEEIVRFTLAEARRITGELDAE